MFNYLAKPRKLTTLDGDFRQPFDPTNAAMFKRYESGYCLFFIIQIPKMLEKLTTTLKGQYTGIEYKEMYAELIWSYIRTLEREFVRLDGIDNINSQSIEFTGMNEVAVNSINTVEENHNPSITLTYREPYGAVLTKVHELFLKGIDDPIVGHRKHYNGLIDDYILTPSFENETFTFLYLITDNTGMRLEKSFYIFNAQPTTAHVGELYNMGRGEYDYKELSYEFKCNILTNDIIDQQASIILSDITGYEYDKTTDTMKPKQVKHASGSPIFNNNEPVYTKPLFTMDSNSYEYRGLIDSDMNIGGMNFPRGRYDPSYIAATTKYGWDNNRAVTKIGSGGETWDHNSMKDNDDGETKRPDGDNNVDNNDKGITIDSPLFNTGDIVYLPAGTLLYNCYGNKDTPKEVKTTSKTDWTEVKVVSFIPKVEAQLYAEQKKVSVIYGQKTTLKPYKIYLNGQYYFCKPPMYIKNADGSYTDPETGKVIKPTSTTTTKTPDPVTPKPTTTIKVGSKVRVRKYAKDLSFGWELYKSYYDKDMYVVEINGPNKERYVVRVAGATSGYTGAFHLDDLYLV